MRRTTLPWLVLLWVGMAGSSEAQQANPLQPFAYLVGGTWVAEGKLGDAGPYRAEVSYRWALGGKFLVSTNVTRVGNLLVVAEGVLGWSAAEDRLGAWSFGNDGSIGIVGVKTTAGDVAVFDVEIIGGADAGPIRGRQERKGLDRFVQVIEALRGGQWVHVATQHFTRKPAGALAPSHDVVTGLATGENPVQPLAPLVGAWTGEYLGEGQKASVTFTFDWVLGRRFIKTGYLIALAGKPEELHAISYIGYDVKQGKLVQYAFSPDSGVVAFTVTPSEDRIICEGAMVGGRAVRVTYRPSPEALETSTEMGPGGRLQPMGTATFRRKP